MAKRPKMADVRFGCAVCEQIWEAPPDRVEDCPADDYHPWVYFATCPYCGALEQTQHRQQRKLLKMWAKATGPKTPEGKAKTAQNVVGHPTPDEARRTRFNAMSHGLNAKVATYFPAKPGKYAACNGCEYLTNICSTQVACLKRTENMLRHQIAFDTKDPSLLTGIRAGMQFGVTSLIDDILLAIAQEGVSLKTPKTSKDKDGNDRLLIVPNEDGEMITLHEVHAHPLLRVLSDILARNNLSLADLRMTPKVVEEEDVLQGQLASQTASREQVVEHQKRQADALENLASLIKQSKEDAKRDPILIDYLKGSQQDNG